MKATRHLILSLNLLAGSLPALAQQPDTLLHSIPPPPGGAQTGAQLGYSVAVDGGYTVVGAPYDDIAGKDSGVVKVFDSATGSLLLLLANPSPAADDSFGYSVAISGTFVVVGAFEDDTGADNAGSAYVYDLSSGTPTVPVLTLNNPSPANHDRFGSAVAISGTRVVVGVPQVDAGATDAGSAYVFDLRSSTPTVPVATLENPSPAASDVFGLSVAISGTRVVVSAHGDDTGATDAGSAYVFDLDGSAPTVPVATLNNPSPSPSDYFGFPVAISGTRVVAGATNDYTGGTYAGSAYVYDLSSTAPTVPVVTLNNPAPEHGDSFGSRVAISGSQVVVGAGSDNNGESNAGSAYVYDLGSVTPTLPTATLNNPTPAAEDYFGTSVAISGSRIVVGARLDSTAAYDAGSAYLYDLGSMTPTAPVATLNNPSPRAGDRFGHSVAMSGTRLIVGAYGLGSAYVYDLGSGMPTVPAVTLNNPSPSSGDGFGYSVAISGTWVVVGTPFDYTGGPHMGSAYVYDLTSTTPTVPVATLTNPSPVPGALFGYAVAISGMRVVVGAFNNNTGTYYPGSAYVYDLGSSTPAVPVTTLISPNSATNDRFGWSVAISGTRVVVGTPFDDTGANNDGCAYVYDLGSGTPMVPVAALNNPDPAEYGSFGVSVAISASRLVVGAVGAGMAYVYDLDGVTPTVAVASLNKPNPATYDSFGNSVAISGTRVVVGAEETDETGATNAGSAYVYDLTSGTPTVPVATLKNPGTAEGDLFGKSVAITGATVALGTPFDDSVTADKGFAYVFAPPSSAITISGHGLAIVDGDASPSVSDATHFGTVPMFHQQVTQTFTAANIGSATLNLTGTPKVQITGADAGDFTVTLQPNSPVAIGESTSFSITFDPKQPGLRSATVSIASDDPANPSHTFAISGFGGLSKPLSQTITFAPPATLYREQSPFALYAYSSSGLPVDFRVISGPATVSGSTLTLTGTGTIKLEATQPGGGNYAAARPVLRTIVVARTNLFRHELIRLSQTYDGSPKPISTLGGGAATITYKIGSAFGPTPPTNAGSYAVKAVAAGVTKTGTLVIAKAPLYVTPDDKRKFAGKTNPALTHTVTGFRGTDTAAVLTKSPVLKTTATTASPGGLYPITASGAAALNYTFIYQQGTLVVESFAGSYEALLVDGSSSPIGKLGLTVTAPGTAFTAKLSTATETTALSFKGTVNTDAALEQATGNATVTKAGVPYVIDFTLPLVGAFSASATRDAEPLGSATDGRKLSTATVLYAGAHTAVLEPATGGSAPAGAGWASATISTKGALTLKGKLGDGTAFTAALSPDGERNPGYRLWAQPNLPARTQSYLAGAFTLIPHPTLANRRYLDAGDMTWKKAGLPADPSYRSGFGPIRTVLMLDPWQKPDATNTLLQRLGLSAPNFAVTHSLANADLPTRLALSTTNKVTVQTPAANLTKWKTLTFKPTDGTFTGSFELLDDPLKRPVSFSGVLRQPADNQDALIGDGHYLLPPVSGTEKTTGEVRFQRP